MSDEKPTLKNIGKEILTEGYWERARERKRASKTWWDLIFRPIGFGGIGLSAYGFFKLAWWMHVLIYPADAGRMHVLMQGAITLPQFLITLVPLFGAIPLGASRLGRKG